MPLNKETKPTSISIGHLLNLAEFKHKDMSFRENWVNNGLFV